MLCGCAACMQEHQLPPTKLHVSKGIRDSWLVSGLAIACLLCLVTAWLQEPLDPVAGFVIEGRIAAVSSLALLTQELLTSQQQQQQGSPECSYSPSGTFADGGTMQPLVSMAFMRQCVLPALYGALRDYSRDNRGDVGSWVREAAMDGTTQLLLLLGTMLPSSQQQQQGDLGSATSAAAAAGGWMPDDVRTLHSSLALQLVGHLLQQSLERIARLRESALINLHTLLQQPAAAAAVPGAAAIAAALPADAAELAGVASLACVSRLGALLLLPWYRSAVLQGLAASIGGVDAALAKEASAALLAQVGGREGSGSSSSNSASAEAGTETGGLVAAAAGSGELRGSVAELLLQLWKQETG